MLRLLAINPETKHGRGSVLEVSYKFSFHPIIYTAFLVLYSTLEPIALARLHRSVPTRQPPFPPFPSLSYFFVSLSKALYATSLSRYREK